MAAQKKYPDELRERAVKMVLEIRERVPRRMIRNGSRSWRGKTASSAGLMRS